MSSRQAAEHARLAVGVSVGSLSGSHAFAHCVIAIPRLAAGGTGRVFPAADVAGFTTPRGSAALSWLTLYMGDCRHILTTIILH